MTATRLHLSVTTDQPELIARTAEHLARAAAGLAMDGADVFISIGPDTDEDDDA